MENDYKLKEDLELLLNEDGETINSLSEKLSISARTINNIIGEKTNPSFETIEKFYSYFYKKGYRLNKTKENIIKEVEKELVLFHGSKNGVKEITKNGSREKCDFGYGFYLGETYDQASSFIYDSKEGSVYAYKANIEGLKTIKYDCSIEWMITVCYYRGMIEEYKNNSYVKNIIEKAKNADIIIAPIADNKMFFIMREFGNGNITTTQAIHSLASSGLGMQYVFKSDKAINRLKLIEHLYLCNDEKNDIANKMNERGMLIDTKLKLAKREFRNEGKYIDELFV